MSKSLNPDQVQPPSSMIPPQLMSLVSPPDVAISAPYGGPDHNGLVYIHNGRPRGPDPSPSQVRTTNVKPDLSLSELVGVSDVGAAGELLHSKNTVKEKVL